MYIYILYFLYLYFLYLKKLIIILYISHHKIGMNGDILMMIYNQLVSAEGNKKYKGIIDTIEECKNKLEQNTQILEA